MARVAAGLAVTAYEETLKLPSTAVALPMTTVSQILQTTMRIQQTMTSLAIKGDQLFELLGAAPAEAPSWATFDEDAEPVGTAEPSTAATPGRFALYSMPPATEAAVPVSAGPEAGTSADAGTKGSGPRAGAESTAESTAAKISAGTTAAGGEGDTSAKAPAKAPAKKSAKAPAKKAAKKTAAGSAAGAELPEIVELLDYPSLTLAQLRARMRTLSVEDLRALLEYESATRARDPFETMLSNRIANASTK